MSIIESHAALLVGLISPFIRIRKKVVLFSSFGGQYNDNPKYISLKLHEKFPEYTQLWVISDKSKEYPPEYTNIIRYGSIEYFKAIYYSEIIIDNHSGLRSSKYEKKKWFMMPLYSFLSRRIKKQLCISTWHGTPIKKIAMDEPGARDRYIFKCSSNYVMAGCTYTETVLYQSLDRKVKIVGLGTPRNDVFFRDIDTINLKKRLGIPSDKKVVLFSPTFRDDIEKSGKIQMESLDIEKLLSTLSLKFGGSWCFVFRLHNLVQRAINFDDLLKKKGNVCIVDGNQCDDMAEYLACTDVLLNDYSSSMFDYALSKKPCFIYAPDFDTYSTQERGLYFDIKSLPFPFATNQEQLLNNINSFDNSLYLNGVNALLDNLGNYETGAASEKVVNMIHQFSNKLDS